MTSLQHWQDLLKQGVSTTAELLSLVHLTEQDIPSALQSTQPFKLRVPRGFIQRMEVGNPNDPLLLQILPVAAELELTPDFSADPLAESTSNPIPGLLQKYKSRALLTVTSACAVNCRFCFRRHFPYADNNPGTNGWQLAMDYLQQHTEIKEIIFSGGDPLTAPDPILANLAKQIADIPHIHTLRIHTRLPMVLPERINDEFITWFTGSRLKPVLVTHCNHAQEIDNAVASAMKRLHSAGVTLLNQTVLLRGINDNAITLAALSEKLFESYTLPYYLHLLDKVQGAAHFDVPLTEAKAIYSELMSLLPGYLVPKLVREIAGASSKTTIL